MTGVETKQEDVSETAAADPEVKEGTSVSASVLPSKPIKHRPSRLSMEGYLYNADTVLEVALNPNTRKLPASLVQDCVGVAILATMYMGAVITFQYGTGIVMAKKKSTEHNSSEGGSFGAGSQKKIEWSAPSSVTTAGYAMGAMVGGKVDSTIIFIMDEETLQDFATRPQTRMGLDMALSVGKFGGGANIGMEAPKKGTHSFTYSNGAYVGAAIQMGTLNHQDKQNEIFYGKKLEPKQILLEGKAEIPKDSEMEDIYEHLDLLANGMTWVPTMDDLNRSKHYLEVAQKTSTRLLETGQ